MLRAFRWNVAAKRYVVKPLENTHRPFEQVFAPGEWQAVPASRTLQSPRALLRRLDDLSCMGCHQSRAVAGFHLLSVDRRGASRTFTTGNALAVPHSPHVQDPAAPMGEACPHSLAAEVQLADQGAIAGAR